MNIDSHSEGNGETKRREVGPLVLNNEVLMKGESLFPARSHYDSSSYSTYIHLCLGYVHTCIYKKQKVIF